VLDRRIQLKVGADPLEDIVRIRAVSEALEPGCPLPLIRSLIAASFS
jgi:hypothetical protein